MFALPPVEEVLYGADTSPSDTQHLRSLRVFTRAPDRRIDDRIRRLCAKAMASSDGDLEPVRRELLKLVRQKMERLKKRAARLFLKGEQLEPERRNIHVIDAIPDASQTAE